jgi:hypothetical protein
MSLAIWATPLPTQVGRRVGDAWRSAGEWNEAELRCEDRVFRFLLNGREVNRVEADRAIVCRPRLHANGTDIRLCNVVLTPLKAAVILGPVRP